MKCTLVALAAAAASTTLVLTAPPASAASPSYVALGDSYSSGTGTRIYINDGTSCQRSVYAYPSLIASARTYALNFRACSGARVSDVTNSQLSALTSSTAYVSISVGGNDAGFSDVLTECAQPGWASDCNGAIDGAQSYINNTLPGALSTLYASIRSKAPNAKVVVGYPRDLQRRGLQRLHLVLAGRGDAPQRHRRPDQQQDVSGGQRQGLLVRQPHQPLHRPRSL